MGKLLPVLLALIGLGGGVGAGIMLKPAPEPPEIAHETNPCGDPEAEGHAPEPAAEEVEGLDPEAEGVFVRLDNQFVIPLIKGGEVASMVVMSLTLEVDPMAENRVHLREPRIRDRFLRIMLDHASAGGFDGAFTSNGQIAKLKTELMESADKEIGPGLRDVLILDLNKQDT